MPLVTALLHTSGSERGAEAGLVEIRFHVQKQAAAGYEIDLQNVVRQRFNG